MLLSLGLIGVLGEILLNFPFKTMSFLKFLLGFNSKLLLPLLILLDFLCSHGAFVFPRRWWSLRSAIVLAAVEGRQKK